MIKRRGKDKLDYTLTKGPGSLSEAMGIHTKDSGTDLTGDKIWIEDRKIIFPSSKIKATKRIGVDYAGKDAHLLYRFVIKDSKWVSGKK
jgi:DNA-3-methyladenine glycosylase